MRGDVRADRGRIPELERGEQGAALLALGDGVQVMSGRQSLYTSTVCIMPISSWFIMWQCIMKTPV